MHSVKFLLLFFVWPFLANAQFTDSLRAQFLKDWHRSKAYTLEYLQAMPGEKYDLSPRDSIRNFAQQMIHLAQANIALMKVATDRAIPDIINRTDLEQRRSAWTKDSVLFFVTLSYDYALEAVKSFDFTKAFERISRGQLNETRFAWALKAYEHQAHHRGQTTLYIRLAGRTPPFEKLFN